MPVIHTLVLGKAQEMDKLWKGRGWEQGQERMETGTAAGRGYKLGAYQKVNNAITETDP